MPSFLLNPSLHIALAVVLGMFGVFLMLPKQRLRSVPGGLLLCVASMATLAAFAYLRYGEPLLLRNGQTDIIGSVMFWFFSAAAVGFSLLLITQRNPARGAIAFAFVILSSCGLFLLLAAPFLMAATIVVYAGAIIVTFLFVLMLSPVRGPSDENDRTREPLLASFAGFGFIGLVLFALHQSSPSGPGLHDQQPFAVFLSASVRTKVEQAFRHADAVVNPGNDAEPVDVASAAKVTSTLIAEAFDSAPGNATGLDLLTARRNDPHVESFFELRKSLLAANAELDEALLNNNTAALNSRIVSLRNQLALMRGVQDLPSRNVANLGTLIYTDYLLGVEMAGTLLLVATIGAIAIAQRRKGVEA